MNVRFSRKRIVIVLNSKYFTPGPNFWKVDNLTVVPLWQRHHMPLLYYEKKWLTIIIFSISIWRRCTHIPKSVTHSFFHLSGHCVLKLIFFLLSKVCRAWILYSSRYYLRPLLKFLLWLKDFFKNLIWYMGNFQSRDSVCFRDTGKWNEMGLYKKYPHFCRAPASYCKDCVQPQTIKC